MGQLVWPEQLIHAGRLVATPALVGDHPHAERPTAFGHGQTDTAQPDNADGPTVQLGNQRKPAEHFLTRPLALSLEAVRIVQAARKHEHHAQHVLGNRNAVEATRVGDNDIALDQLREQDVRSPGRSEVEPFELGGGRQVLLVEADGAQDLGVGQFGQPPVRVLDQIDVGLRKFVLQLPDERQGKIRPAGQPGRAGKRNTHLGHGYPLDGPIRCLPFACLANSSTARDSAPVLA